MASPNLTELVTTTLRNRSGTLADNVTNHNALLKKINTQGNRQPATGRVIVEELEYAENSTTDWYSGYDLIDTTPQDVLTAAEFDWRQLSGAVTMSGLEQIQNSGKEAIINWLEARLKNLEHSMENQLATSLYADGSNAKEIDGLRVLVSDTGQGTVGGINSTSAANAFWRNSIYDISDEGGTASAAGIQAAMHALQLRVIRGSDAPDFWVADDTYFTFYWDSLTEIQRITRAEEGEGGFRSLSFVGAPVVYDDQCPAAHMYALNTRYMKLRFSPQENFVPGEARMSVNQNAFVIPVFWAGNLTVSNRARQGVIVA